ncbi:Uncharacterized protein TCM_008722 [Theobroma cacao]|uniref:Transmembrane protein n=2 Tax=Byttnerioideae TaxID=214909 RepID=A0A061E4A2_THECC|nr:Uncharacterized protein TCM_008722 [Theobroma cacao]
MNMFYSIFIVDFIGEFVFNLGSQAESWFCNSSTSATIMPLQEVNVCHLFVNSVGQSSRLQRKIGKSMADWGPVVIAVVLFVLLSPGLLFQLPGRSKVVEFGNMQTSGISILVHTIIFFGLITIFLIAIGVHIYTG